jgi:hypothetical protein
MPTVEHIRTRLVSVETFVHAPRDHPSVTEWWPEDCVAFTMFGSWQVRARPGRG